MPQPSALDTLLKNLHAVLEAQGISQAELARRARMPQTTVSRVFKALEDRVSPRLDTLESIARGLRVPLEALLVGGPAPQPSEQTASPHSLARQLGRLTEDFMLSDEIGRREILAKANDCANKASRTTR